MVQDAFRMHITRMIAYFQRLLEHMFWADTAVLELLSADDDPSAGRLFAHLLAAERIWLLRLRGKDSTSQPVWPDLDVNGMRLLAQSNADEYARFLADLAEDGLQEEVAYATSRGAQFRNTVADIITHVALHGSYHRGQVAAAVRRAGGDPVNTDFINFARHATRDD
jgi:uncharacterized damage-inducible protein DinB